MGMTVEITITVAEVKGRAVTLEIAAKDNLDPIAKGKHSRFVVDVAKTKERLAAKAAKAKG
jgi:predicted thioesterase